MTTPKTITNALRKGPVRCCVAWPPLYHPNRSVSASSYSRGTTGSLEASLIRGHLMFTTDCHHRVHFKWHEWQGLHIPSLQIFRS